MAMGALQPNLFSIPGGLACAFKFDNVTPKTAHVNLVALTRRVHLRAMLPNGKRWDRDISPGSPERLLNFKPKDFGNLQGYMRMEFTAMAGDAPVQPGEIVVEHDWLT